MASKHRSFESGSQAHRLSPKISRGSPADGTMTLTSCLHLLLSAVLAADPGASEAAKIYPYPDGVIQNIWHFNPEPGWWVLKDRPGTGFALERQGSDTVSDTYFLAMFTYDPDGRPTFYTMTGRYDYATKRLTGTFDRAEGGGVRLEGVPSADGDGRSGRACRVRVHQ